MIASACDWVIVHFARSSRVHAAMVTASVMLRPLWPWSSTAGVTVGAAVELGVVTGAAGAGMVGLSMVHSLRVCGYLRACKNFSLCIYPVACRLPHQTNQPQV